MEHPLPLTVKTTAPLSIDGGVRVGAPPESPIALARMDQKIWRRSGPGKHDETDV